MSRSRPTRQQILTVPNAITVLRIALIPLFLFLYCARRLYLPAACVLALSDLTDVLDGAVARKYHMVSDLGKLLDPAADKLTQAALLLCLCVRYRGAAALLGLFAAKELWQLALALLLLRRRDTVRSALWHGKLNTAVLELSAALLLFLPVSETAAAALLALCLTAMLLSAALYTRLFVRLLRRA